MQQEFEDFLEEDHNQLYEHFSITVDKGQSLLRIDKFLMIRIENATRNKIQQAAENGNILVNNLPVKSNYKVKPGDFIQIMLENPPREHKIIAEDLPLNIVFEDDQVLVIDKPAGMVVHPGHGNYSGTLVNALKFHFDNLPSMSAELERPGLVHRIDKDTSGLLVIAKTEQAMNHLALQFANHTTTRKYNALVWGNVTEDEGTITGHIGRHLKDRMQMAVFEDGSQGKHAVTHYKVLERLSYVTLVECQLETGRTHQIRTHFKYIGHPLFNDERYGGNKILKGTTFTKYKQFVENCFNICPRQALHARTLGFTHPTTGEFMEFEATLPNDMQSLIEKWRNYAIHSSHTAEPETPIDRNAKEMD
ncbi:MULTISPECIES: RluA family pseudouridine synthase [Weeksella]|uniref:Pseudouridine synthase n=1 Tax=Weeksella virosa (strain ATCC 43766 / DSM 16922 / JCM 21250 / CCUG 30538 / CDC 9751 / IAM 14551 / NBRC 16016 / NCTC 11634 / CL345/78) TaxID=865938 RepID=F0NZA1_WEEVC|nr:MULTISPECIES: RluA family pseudouridine synthase [Weeksella]ADX67230.1 pseudouridine synthase, RluA family [Weeksella virosa DSM 16922]MDK7375039.1 RluA family pseudouridine synthase [Weeksella virosa]OFM81673.1 RNA pseudouridine synthase [Weeksella sp. HMSC059D05]VEH63034.1 Ribosomal large subunit pseudouridine synthase D [Weeksella virosa]